ncbi:MAG: hypothetical protein ACI9JN_000975 [Bacteroidia bacterium]|jgi:hypothetical protein
MIEFDILDFLIKLGLPTAISAVVVVLAKELSGSRQQKSKESLLDWLKDASTTEPFKDDDKAMNALNELRQSLVFERAFGLKADLALRNQLLAFAETNHDSMKLEEITDACRRMQNRVSLTQLPSPMVSQRLKVAVKLSKPIGYICMLLGVISFYGGMVLAIVFHTNNYLSLALVVMGFVLSAFLFVFGRYNVKHSRRVEIVEAFLRSWADNTHSNNTVVV